jgi:predicted nucleotidyltransferase
MIYISDEEREIVTDIIKKQTKDCEVLVFGSRLTKNHKLFSDLDLAFKCKNGLKFKTKAKLLSEFEYSDLPYRVDLVDYNKVSQEFQKIIDEKNEKIYENRNEKE